MIFNTTLQTEIICTLMNAEENKQNEKSNHYSFCCERIFNNTVCKQDRDITTGPNNTLK